MTPLGVETSLRIVPKGDIVANKKAEVEKKADILKKLGKSATGGRTRRFGRRIKVKGL